MSITKKLFIFTILPTITILLFAVNNIYNKYNILKRHRSLLISTKIIQSTKALLRELQLERTLSIAYIQNQNTYFKHKLISQKNKTNPKISNFINSIPSNILKLTNQTLIKDIKYLFKSLNAIRDKTMKHNLLIDDSFSFYSYLNTQLIELVQNLYLHSANKEIYNDIMAFKKLLVFTEYAGQERALVIILTQDKLSNQGLRKFYNLLELQLKELKYMKKFLNYNNLGLKLKDINIKYSNSYIHIVREKIKDANLKEIDIQLWIKSTTLRINDFYDLENSIFLFIQKNLKDTNNDIRLSLIYLIILTSLTIFSLLLGAYLAARNIKNSLVNLDLGINNFFDFLNFKINTPQQIIINSKDELNEMANKINQQILYIQTNLEDDRDFISETTRIVEHMKNGNFSEYIYFEPVNPNLLKLKLVFNELVNLITNKIKEQTKSLESLNSSLEYKVYQQTLELERQLEVVTISRDNAISAKKSKDDFLANMSHEIRTPLNAILGFVKILEKRITDEKNKGYLNIITNSGYSLLTIINDILDFSKIQSGKFIISPREIDPLLEFSNTTLLFASKAYEKHIIYAVYIDPNIPKNIKVDDTRVKQILSNLLSNAIKFTPRDGIVKVSILIKKSNLFISVQDSGIGIAKHNLEKVFSEFEQADTTTTREYGGTGLGLSISSKLAKLMHGILEVNSIEGKGSTFKLKIPIDIIDNSAKVLFSLNQTQQYKFAILTTPEHDKVFIQLIKKYLNDFGINNIIELNVYYKGSCDILFFIPDDKYNDDIIEANVAAIAILRSNQIELSKLNNITSLYAPFTPNLIVQAIDEMTVEHIQEITIDLAKTIQNDTEISYNAKVLVAEDNKTNQMLISLILDDYGISYHIANNGLEAVEIFKEKSFDLVLMDENMPKLNGLGAMKLIKAYEKQNSLEQTPIIALTAAVLESDVKRFISEGMDGFVAKPIDTSKLEIEFDKYLRRL